MRIQKVEDAPGWDGNEGLLGIIVRDLGTAPDGVASVTAPELLLQVLSVRYPGGHAIPAHLHPRRYPPIRAEVPAEAIMVLMGKVEVTFYRSNMTPVRTETLGVGEVVILCGGGHSFRMLEDSHLFEVRQGPYLGGSDKIRFHGAGSSSRGAGGAVGG